MTETFPAAASPTSRFTRESDSRPPIATQTEGWNQASKSPLVEVSNLQKTYKTARGELTLFRDLSLQVQAGEMVAIVGQSGAGKSSLLHILGALDTPSAGTVYCASTNVAQLGPRQAAAFRNREIGYVWQFHYLLPEFTALENVAMPLLARGERRTAALEKARVWLGENRPYWLDNVLVRYDLQIRKWQERGWRFEEVVRTFESGKDLPAADSLGLPAAN